MVRLLHSCCKYLHGRNMAGAFLDALTSTEAGVETLGEHRLLGCGTYYRS